MSTDKNSLLHCVCICMCVFADDEASFEEERKSGEKFASGFNRKRTKKAAGINMKITLCIMNMSWEAFENYGGHDTTVVLSLFYMQQNISFFSLWRERQVEGGDENDYLCAFIKWLCACTYLT